MDAQRHPTAPGPRAALAPLTLTAIGVVYGDIGTSPLYAMRECFFGSHSVPPTHANVLGVLSLIIYSLALVISVKYMAIVLRADNPGEGGILALTALLPARAARRGQPALVLLGIFGAALLYGDGMISTILIVVGFGSSSALAAAYGIAVTMTMGLTVILLHVVITERWKWPLPLALLVSGVFLAIDGAFFGANVLKIAHGGWLPLVIAATVFALMTTWKTGRGILAARLTARALPLEDFMAAVEADPPVRVSGTAVFMTAQPQGTPPALAHNVRHNKVLHEYVVVLTVTTQPVPYVAERDQVEVQPLGRSVFNVAVRCGFMQDPNVPAALALARARGLEMDERDVTFFLGRETIIVTRRRGMAAWREKLFVLMARTAVRATAFFRLPAERVVELGVQVEM